MQRTENIVKALEAAVKRQVPKYLDFKTSVRLQKTEKSCFKCYNSKKIETSICLGYAEKDRPKYEASINAPFLLVKHVTAGSWDEVLMKAMVEINKIVAAKKILGAEGLSGIGPMGVMPEAELKKLNLAIKKHDMSRNQIIAMMRPYGYYLAREYFPWGRSLGFQGPAGDWLYYEWPIGLMRIKPFMKHVLKEWMPVTREDMSIKQQWQGDYERM